MGVRFDNASFRYEDASGGTGEANWDAATAGGFVEGIDLEVAPGTCTVLCGQSGHGKSTVLRMAAGLAGSFYPGTANGSVEVCGQAVGKLSPEERAQMVGVVMQDPRSQFFMNNVADEVAFSLENIGAEPALVVREVRRAARLCGVEGLLAEDVSNLSSGQKQRVAIAAAIAARPAVLLLDEPTSNLDADGTGKLVEILGALKSQGAAILICEHRLAPFAKLADEFVYMEGGRIRARWRADELANMPADEIARLNLRALDRPTRRALPPGAEARMRRKGSPPHAWELRGVTYLYPKTGRGIRGVTATFPCGSVTVVTGLNGAGKTTLAKALCGAVRQQEGEVLRDGRPLAPRQRRRMSYFVMQDADYQLYAGSVADEVVLGRKVDGALRSRAWEALDAFGLRELADRHPASLSGGQKQRVTLAAAYCSDAELVVLDEPTSGLDGRGARQVAAWCQTLADAGKAVVVITHDRDLAALVGDRKLALDQGERNAMSEKPASKGPGAFAKLGHFMKPDRAKMAASLVLACIGEMAGMVPYLVVAALAAGLVEGTLTLERAALLSLAAAVAQIARFIFTWRSSMMSHRIAFRALERMRVEMAEKMARVPMGTIVDTPTGTFKNRFVDNVNQLEDAIAHFMPELPSNVFGPLLAMAVVFAIDWRMGLAGLATIPLGALFYAGMMRGYKAKMARYVKGEQAMNSSLVEYVNGIQVIKAFGRTASSYGAFSDAVAEFHDSTIDWYRRSWLWMAAIRAVVPCTFLATVPLGVLFMADGSLTLPAFLTCIVIPLGFIGPVLKFVQAAGQIPRMDACLGVIWDFLESPELVRPEAPADLAGERFEFDGVSFSYRDGTEVLHKVSFSTEPGTVTALVGPSGCGKSTIAKLMAGFWDATEGQVRFGGVDVRSIPFTQLMGCISYVGQDTFLFDRTLADNIRLGVPDATDAQVEAAARAAGCHEFISALEHGYATGAGEAGERLSGGEKQRIAIARALLKDAPVVILDEATAYADPENEAYVERAISELVRGKTLVTIAHRLSTIKGADQILVIDGGRIVGRGTHGELLDACPLYARMWEDHVATLVQGDRGLPAHAPCSSTQLGTEGAM